MFSSVGCSVRGENAHTELSYALWMCAMIASCGFCSDFLGRFRPSKTTTRKTLNTLGVEESSSPRRVLHLYSSHSSRGRTRLRALTLKELFSCSFLATDNRQADCAETSRFWLHSLHSKRAVSGYLVITDFGVPSGRGHKHTR